VAWKLTVAGATKTTAIRQPDGVSVDFTLNERTTARFTCNPEYLPSRFQEVLAYAEDGVTPLFGGIILTRRQKPLFPGKLDYLTEIEAVDFSVYADWCYIDLEYTTSVSMKTILQDIITLKLGAYGITLDPAQVTGPTLGAFKWTTFRVSDGLREVCDRTGYAYRVSPTKVLTVFLPGTDPAPYTITDAAPNCVECLWADKSDPAVNKVTVKCGPDGTWSATQTWVANGTDTSWTTDLPAAPLVGSIPAVAAYAFLYATGGNMGNGETVTVGGKTYTFQTVLTDVDGNVLIGGTAALSMEHLSAAIALSGGAGSTYAAVMTANTEVTAYMQSDELMTAKALVPGEAGNSIGCTETCANFEWVGEGTVPRDVLGLGADGVDGSGGTAGYVTIDGVNYSVCTGGAFEWDGPTHTLSVGTASVPTAGQTITLIYVAQGPFTVTVTAVGSPVVEHVVAEEAITTYAAGLDVANALLAQLGASVRELEVVSLLAGWAPGQALTVDLTGRATGGFSITGVSVQLVYDLQGGARDAEYWRFTVKADETVVYNTSYLQQWRDLSSGGGSSGSGGLVVNVGGGGGTGGTANVPVYLGGSRYHPVQILPPVAWPQTADGSGVTSGGPVGVTETKVTVWATLAQPATTAVAISSQAVIRATVPAGESAAVCWTEQTTVDITTP
jgi:hypothetical protein